MSVDDVMGHLKQLHRAGKISDRQYARCVPGDDEIDDPAFQRDAEFETGMSGTEDFGPREVGKIEPAGDVGHIDAAINRRSGDRESKARGRMPSARAPTIAEAKAASASEWNANWFRDISGPSRN